jgi:hypothetical protein
VEAVAEFGVELAGVVEVEAAEGEGVVEQDASIGTAMLASICIVLAA